jgi:hypothetical protein
MCRTDMPPSVRARTTGTADVRDLADSDCSHFNDASGGRGGLPSCGGLQARVFRRRDRHGIAGRPRVGFGANPESFDGALKHGADQFRGYRSSVVLLLHLEDAAWSAAR